MLDVAFTYSYENGRWVECTDTDLVKKEIEDISCVTLVKYDGYVYRHRFNTYYVFCPKHNAMENIFDISDNRVVSGEGCSLEGLLEFVTIHCGIDGCFDNEPFFIPYRWRIYHSSPSKPVNIACGVMRVKDDVNGILTKWFNFSLSVDFIGERYVISKFRK